MGQGAAQKTPYCRFHPVIPVYQTMFWNRTIMAGFCDSPLPGSISYPFLNGGMGGMTSILEMLSGLILNFALYCLTSVLSGVSVERQEYQHVLQM